MLFLLGCCSATLVDSMENGTETVLYWPLALYVAGVLVVVGGMLGSSYLLGHRAPNRAKQEPYESGVKATGSSNTRLSISFYLMATFFVIFDLESVFVFAWAIAIRELGWVVYAQMVVFLVVVAAALVYLWREGALEGSHPHGGGRS